MATGAELSQFTDPAALGTSPTLYLYAGADITWARPCRFLRATTAGNITFKDATGSNVTGAWAAGETRAVYNSGIVAASTTATGIEAMV